MKVEFYKHSINKEEKQKAWKLMVWKRTNALLLRLCGRLIGGADAWHEAMKLYRQQPGMQSIACFFSVGSAIFNIFAIHFMMLAVGSSTKIFESLILGPLLILANTLPFAPGWIGVAERSSAMLYPLVRQAGGVNGMPLTRVIIVFHALLGLHFSFSRVALRGKHLKHPGDAFPLTQVWFVTSIPSCIYPISITFILLKMQPRRIP